jgi:hypothetical protein
MCVYETKRVDFWVPDNRHKSMHPHARSLSPSPSSLTIPLAFLRTGFEEYTALVAKGGSEVEKAKAEIGLEVYSAMTMALDAKN